LIYWFKKLEWKIRKWLGLYKKRVRTINDVSVYNEALFWKVVILLFAVMIGVRVLEALAGAWVWFFPRPSHFPVIPL
jgi:hypothetical protein